MKPTSMIFVPSQLDWFKGQAFDLIPLHKPDAVGTNGRQLGKAPIGANWPNLPPMSVEDAKAHMQGGANVGVRLADHDLVIDVDPRNFPPKRNPLSELEAHLKIDLESFPNVETGGGGRHFYLRKPADWPVVSKLPEYPGIEFKTAGTQVVAPGSLHPDTRRPYRWDALSVPLSDISEAPSELLIAVSRARSVSAGKEEPGARTPEVLEQLLQLLEPTEFRDYDAWLRLMMACHHCTAGAGREQFIEWSTGDAEFAHAGEEIGRKWDSLKSSRNAAVTEGTLFKAICQAGRGDALNALLASEDFAGIDEERPVAAVPPKLLQVNERHFTVLTAGKYVVGRESIDPHFKHVIVEWFPDIAVRKHLDAETVTLEDGTRRPLGSWWITHADRRKYEGVVFDPTPGAVHPGLYNLWRGWSVEGAMGDWSLMQKLLREVLCAGDEASFLYAIKWAAFMVQHPNVPAEVALVFKGRKGVGKGTFLRSLKDLAGQHGRQVAQPEHFTGKFNEHLADTILLFVDEGLWAGDRKLEGALKNLITEPTLTFEGKHKPVVTGPNRLHVAIASNEDWIVPASDDERRFAVFEADPEAHSKLPPDFFGSLREQMEGGGLAAMLHDLERMSLDGWHPRSDIPVTRALTEQKVQSFRSNPIAFWWHSALEDGRLITGQDWSQGLDVSSAGKDEFLYAVQQQAARMGKRAEFSKTAIARFLGRVGVEVRARDKQGGKVWAVPSLLVARAAFEEWVGGKLDWDGGE